MTTIQRLIELASSLGAQSGLSSVDRDDPRLRELAALAAAADTALNASATAAPEPLPLDAACRAHWPSWDRMRPDNARKWREKMRAALVAAVQAGLRVRS